ncbi:conserved uncharacterized protein [Stigmatella aurantiaca DW4/3-1]|nr:conserved uncharacterized protein [Stigmatella aurantiaca DW4/3-1]
MLADPARALVMTSVQEASRSLVLELDQSSLESLLKELESSFEIVLRVLEQPEVLKMIQTVDPLALARVRGLRARQELLSAEGGSVGASDLAKLLEVTRQTVDDRRKAGKLLGVERGKHGYAYPIWQVSEEGQPLKGLEEVLAALRDHDTWSKLNFFLSKDPRLPEHKHPLDALRAGEVDKAVGIAKTYGEHGGL